MYKVRRTPAILIIAIIVFSGIGFILTHTVFADMKQDMENQLKKLVNVARLAQLYYVEDVNWDTAAEGAIIGMLEKLDPHSVYVPPQKAEENKENFSGEYEGIGIQFDVLDGFITVLAPIPGSPSEQLGLTAGDRIVKINGKSVIGISRDKVPEKLRGPKGTTVDVTILREGVDESLEFTITRDVIPISTITASFMVDDSTGYLAVNRFAAITSKEVEEELSNLEKQNMKKLILDLRWNSGGYLHEAVKMAGKFIEGHKLIVYTKDRSKRIDEEYYADQFGRGKTRDYPLIILINRGSASASEIVAGAIQDYDRGLIVGENSFGKGLVQKEFPLEDGSVVRITTAKYYTPSGRCIQRDYKGKNIEQYYEDIPDSTWVSDDSLKNRPLFYTESGRSVYGGGGIQPDIYASLSGFSKSPELTNKMLQKRLFFEYANFYVIKHPEIKSSVTQFKDQFQVSDQLFRSFKGFCREKKLDFDDREFDKDVDYIKIRLKAEIAQRMWDKNAYYYIILSEDHQFQMALKSFNEAKRIATLE
jgi:carboxyl-terminal processing protease